MILKTGNLWEEEHNADIIAVTTCGVLKQKDTSLIMGAGIAKEAAGLFPSSPKDFANIIRSYPRVNDAYYLYGFVRVETWNHKLAAFQTKANPYEPAKISIIMLATNRLCDYARRYTNKTIFLNFPGIGLGSLKLSDIVPIVNKLPDNVIVWKIK